MSLLYACLLGALCYASFLLCIFHSLVAFLLKFVLPYFIRISSPLFFSLCLFPFLRTLCDRRADGEFIFSAWPGSAALSPLCKGYGNWFCFEYSDVCLFVPARKIIYLTMERYSGGALIFLWFGWAVMEKWGKYKACVGSDAISNKQDWFGESEPWFMPAL